MVNRKNFKLYNQAKLVNFLPLVVNNFLKKGEKEKTFVKVSKVLKRIKKTNLLNNMFFVNKRIFINKIIFILKNNNLISKTNLNAVLNNNNNLQFFKSKIKSRNDLDNLLISRNSFFLNNFYFYDFYQFFRYKELLKIELAKKRDLVSKKKSFSIFKILMKKKILNFFYMFYKKFNFYKNDFNYLLNSFLKLYKKNQIDLISKKLFSFINLTTVLNRFYKFYFIVFNIFNVNKPYLLNISNYFKNYILKNFSILKFRFNTKLIFKINYILNNHNNKKKFFFVNKKKKIQPYKRKYYYLSKKTKLLKLEHKKLDKKYFNLKKLGKKMPRFEFKKRKFLYIKLMKAYRESRKLFFRFKRYKKYLKNKKFKNSSKKINVNIEQKKLLNHLDFKYYIVKKPIEKTKKNLRLNFFKYSLFPLFFSPAKFFNICLSYYRLYFTFKDQKVWGKQQKIPTILNLQRDVRITVRNFKKILVEKNFNNSNFMENFFENVLLAGSKKGFFYKMKKQAYIFMIKNAIFLQFLMRRRKNKLHKKRRRKKIDRK